MLYDTLTLLHHADVHAALQSAGLAVAAVVLGDGATPAEGTGEGGLALHAAPARGRAAVIVAGLHGPESTSLPVELGSLLQYRNTVLIYRGKTLLLVFNSNILG